MNSENLTLTHQWPIHPTAQAQYTAQGICYLRIHPFALALVLANPSSSNQEFVPGFLSFLDSENSFYLQFDTWISSSHSNCSGPFQKLSVSSSLLSTYDFSSHF